MQCVTPANTVQRGLLRAPIAQQAGRMMTAAQRQYAYSVLLEITCPCAQQAHAGNVLPDSTTMTTMLQQRVSRAPLGHTLPRV